MTSALEVRLLQPWVARFIIALQQGGIPYDYQNGLLYLVGPSSLLVAINWTDFTRAAVFERLAQALHSFASYFPDEEKFAAVYKAVHQAMDELSTAEMPQEAA